MFVRGTAASGGRRIRRRKRRDPARPRGRLGAFIIGVLAGLIGGVLLVWLGIFPSFPVGRPAPLGSAPPPAVAKDGKTTPAEADTEDSAKSAQPQAELALLAAKGPCRRRTRHGAAASPRGDGERSA